MKQYILNFMAQYDYPQPAVETLTDVFNVLKDNLEFNYILENYYTDETINEDSEEGRLHRLCKDTGINFFTAKLLLYIYLSKSLREKYIKSGYSEDFWRENIGDLKIKMMECFAIHKIWGLFSIGWFPSIFRMKTFTLGRMCYNVIEYDGDDFTIGRKQVKKGDRCICIHIPSSGKPFDRATRLESYKLAHEFFGLSLFRCESWLLYPPNREILGERSNIVSFMNDFEIVKSYEYDDDMWRIFGDKHNLPADELPRDSSLRKAYADFLMNGNKLGVGVGYFIFDAENNNTLK